MNDNSIFTLSAFARHIIDDLIESKRFQGSELRTYEGASTFKIEWRSFDNPKPNPIVKELGSYKNAMMYFKDSINLYTTDIRTWLSKYYGLYDPKFYEIRRNVNHHNPLNKNIMRSCWSIIFELSKNIHYYPAIAVIATIHSKDDIAYNILDQSGSCIKDKKPTIEEIQDRYPEYTTVFFKSPLYRLIMECKDQNDELVWYFLDDKKILGSDIHEIKFTKSTPAKLCESIIDSKISKDSLHIIAGSTLKQMVAEISYISGQNLVMVPAKVFLD